jgi:ketosteroid isomerase-like protein
VVRRPLAVRERSRRALNQTLAIRAPRCSAVGARLVGMLPPRSRVRHAVIWLAARQGAEAYNRRDFDAVLIGRHRDAEYHPPRELVENGVLEPVYRGHDGFRRFATEWLTAWGEFRGEPRELIDAGHRLVVLADAIGRGQASGVPVRQPFSVVISFRRGIVVRERYFTSDSEAIEAAGLG